ncbi:MAG: FecR domain-containing protein [Halieaceae bacterium]|nr:FecR domain-containing protein [Halieaceae bacterium]
MNKATSFILMALLLTVTLAPLQAVAAKTQTAKVVFLRGNVTATDATTATPRKLRRGSRVEVGETVNTAKKALAQLVFPDKSILLVRADSQVQIEAYRFKPKEAAKDKSVIRLLKGGMRSLSGVLGKRSAAKVRYRTRFSTIGIRGTAVDVDEEGQGERITFDIGYGWVGNNGGTLDLGEGQSAFIALLDSVPVYFDYQQPRDDPAFIVRTLSNLPVGQVQGWLQQNRGLVNEGSAIMLVGMTAQLPNSDALMLSMLSGLQGILPAAGYGRVLGTATSLQPYQAPAMMRQSIDGGLSVQQALLSTLGGLVNGPRDVIDQVVQSGADLGITPEQAREVLKALSDRGVCN